MGLDRTWGLLGRRGLKGGGYGTYTRVKENSTPKAAPSDTWQNFASFTVFGACRSKNKFPRSFCNLCSMNFSTFQTPSRRWSHTFISGNSPCFMTSRLTLFIQFTCRKKNYDGIQIREFCFVRLRPSSFENVTFCLHTFKNSPQDISIYLYFRSQSGVNCQLPFTFVKNLKR